MREDIKYIYCCLGSLALAIFPLLNTLYMPLWVTSFVDTGYITVHESEKIVSNIALATTIATPFAVVFVFFIGDKVKPHILVPSAFFARAFTTLMFLCFVDVPDTIWMKVI